jgi:amino acid permease
VQCHVQLVPIVAELRPAHRDRTIRAAVGLTFAICVGLYFAVGFFGFVTFGRWVQAWVQAWMQAWMQGWVQLGFRLGRG